MGRLKHSSVAMVGSMITTLARWTRLVCGGVPQSPHMSIILRRISMSRSRMRFIGLRPVKANDPSSFCRRTSESAQRFALKALWLLLVSSILPASLIAQTQSVGATTIPNGRQITPVGDWIPVAPFPFALALRPDGRQLVAPSLGFPFALNLIDRPASAERKVTQNPNGFLSIPG